MSDQSKASNEDRQHDSESEEEISDEHRDLNSDGHVSDKKQHETNSEENANDQEPSPVPNTNGPFSYSNFLLKRVLPIVLIGTATVIAAPFAAGIVGTIPVYAGAAAVGAGLGVRDNWVVQCEDRKPNNSSPQRQQEEQTEGKNLQSTKKSMVSLKSARNRREIPVVIDEIYEEVEKEEVKDNPSQKKGKKIGQKSYYDASGKSGLLCIIQLEQTWGEGNKKDTHVLNEFFKKTLGFDVEEYSSYRELNTRLGKCSSLSSKQYYCLVIYISGYENQEGVDKIHKKMKSIHAIKKRFGNEKIKTLAGVPKIIIVDTCRKGNNNKKGSQGNILTKSLVKDFKSVTVLPTTDSDCILIHATTNEIYANIPDKGSVGLQGVMDIFTKNWEKDHLEEMLIDARMKVSTSVTVEVRKILEIETTLLKRLKFEKFERRLQVSK